MTKRTAAMLGVLVLVLGAGLAGLWLADRPRAPRTAAVAVAAEPAPPAPPTRPPARSPVMPSRPRADRDADSGVIDGRVINGMTHDGIPGAELTFLGDGGVSTFRTSGDGSFEAVPAATGSFTLVSIAASGFLPYGPQVGFSAAHVGLTHGQAIHGVTLLLYPAVDYAGIVVDARGAPVAGARVQVLAPPGEPALESPPEWKTGGDGRFTFQAADGAVLEASRGALRGWAHVDRNVTIMKKLTIRLGHAPPRDETITGSVRDAAGAPLADAVVRATPSDYYSTAPTVVAVTATDGTFTLAGVDRGRYDLSAEAADHVPATRPSITGGSRGVELTLEAGLPLAGQVVDLRGAPIPAFTLIVQRHVGLARAAAATVSLIDPQGRFSLYLARGDYDLIAAVPDQPRTAVQAAAGATDVRIVVGRSAILRGRVVASDGTPIADAFVGLVTTTGGPRTPAVVPVTATRSDGSFELEGLAPGPLAIDARARGYTHKLTELPPAPSGVRDPITIELASAPDRGVPERGVADRPPGGDIIGIGVQIVPDDDALRIVGVLPHSGALEAGVAEGDLIIAVEGIPVATLGTSAAVARLRGPAGTRVTLTLRRNGHDGQLAVERRPLRS